MNMNETTPDIVDEQPNLFMHLIAPMTATGATMLVRKVLNAGYQRSSGRTAPDPRDPRVNIGRALMWAIVTAATAAAVETVVYRAMNRGTHTD